MPPFYLQDALGNMGVSGAPQVFGASAIVTWAKIRRCSVSVLKSSSTIWFMKNVRFPLFLRPKMKECLLRKRMPINFQLMFLGEGPMLQKTKIGPEKMSHVFQSHQLSGTCS